ncbi:MAG: hypothetical protein WCI66_07360 [Gammaproteobacteria bacterium]
MSWLRSLQYRVLALILALSACSLASAQVEKYLNGTHYRLVSGVPAVPQWQGSADKPNVTEIFWYGCPHCYEFDAVLAAWVASHGDTINFSRSPMIWTPISRQHAHIYFERDRELFDTLYPRLQIRSITYHSPLTYIVSGGVARSAMLPGFMYGLVRAVEGLLSPFARQLGLFCTIELQKLPER